ncbi:MAG: nicotinate-nucleotide adenylyltransferase [Pseudomonadota bacterium]|jgi:nicotinate-nucleotide adenylyltransferase
MSVRSVLLLGGSFDPVHSGHVGLARYFCTLLHPDELRLIPSGRPWQKPDMVTPAVHRVAMLHAAFDGWPVPICIDEQEIRREGPSYMIDTLRSLRSELGRDVSLALIMGADQLVNLHTWRDWAALFDETHLCIASRPGFTTDNAALDKAVATQITRRLASADQLRQTPSGLVSIATQLALDVSSTTIRAALGGSGDIAGLLPAPVLDYIQQHHLYQTH